MKLFIALLLILAPLAAQAEPARCGYDAHGNRICASSSRTPVRQIDDATRICINRCEARGEQNAACIRRCLNNWR